MLFIFLLFYNIILEFFLQLAILCFIFIPDLSIHSPFPSFFSPPFSPVSIQNNIIIPRQQHTHLTMTDSEAALKPSSSEDDNKANPPPISIMALMSPSSSLDLNQLRTAEQIQEAFKLLEKEEV